MTEETTAPKPKEPAWRTIRENLEAVVIAFAFALIIRCFFVEVFEIPTSSMEPTLLGQDPDFRLDGGRPVDSVPYRDYHTGPGGDRIMVTKFYFGLGSIERFDVVVFRFPLNIPKNFIKRVVGLPGEEFMVFHGNLYSRPSDSKDQPFRIAVKPPKTQESAWIRVGAIDGFLHDPKVFKSHWTVEGVADDDPRPPYEIRGDILSTLATGERGVTFRYQRELLDYPEGSNPQPVDDLNLSMSFELTDQQAQFTAGIRNRYGLFSLRLGGRESNVLMVTRGDDVHTIDISGRVDPDRFHRIDLMVYDGQVVARLNGADTSFRFLQTRQEAELSHPGRAVWFGGKGGAISVRSLRLSRDIHYKVGGDHRNLKEGTPIRIPKGQYLMMGDNTARSQDSRAWTRVQYRLKGGRVVICEQAERLEGFAAADFAEKEGISPKPDVIIRSDLYGNQVHFYDADVEVGPVETAAPFVDERFVVGKALWIWWPVDRLDVIR